ncbi:MAG: hypothetical protein WCE68_07365 [Anaerolineales bacterium]
MMNKDRRSRCNWLQEWGEKWISWRGMGETIKNDSRGMFFQDTREWGKKQGMSGRKMGETIKNDSRGCFSKTLVNGAENKKFLHAKWAKR